MSTTESFLSVLSVHIQHLTSTKELQRFIPFLVNTQELKSFLLHQLSLLPKRHNYTTLTCNAYYKLVPLDVILPNDLLYKMIGYMGADDFEYLPLLSKHFQQLTHKYIIDNNYCAVFTQKSLKVTGTMIKNSIKLGPAVTSSNNINYDDYDDRAIYDNEKQAGDIDINNNQSSNEFRLAIESKFNYHEKKCYLYVTESGDEKTCATDCLQSRKNEFAWFFLKKLEISQLKQPTSSVLLVQQFGVIELLSQIMSNVTSVILGNKYSFDVFNQLYDYGQKHSESKLTMGHQLIHVKLHTDFIISLFKKYANISIWGSTFSIFNLKILELESPQFVESRSALRKNINTFVSLFQILARISDSACDDLGLNLNVIYIYSNDNTISQKEKRIHYESQTQLLIPKCQQLEFLIIRNIGYRIDLHLNKHILATFLIESQPQQLYCSPIINTSYNCDHDEENGINIIRHNMARCDIDCIIFDPSHQQYKENLQSKYTGSKYWLNKMKPQKVYSKYLYISDIQRPRLFSLRSNESVFLSYFDVCISNKSHSKQQANMGNNKDHEDKQAWVETSRSPLFGIFDYNWYVNKNVNIDRELFLNTKKTQGDLDNHITKQSKYLSFCQKYEKWFKLGIVDFIHDFSYCGKYGMYLSKNKIIKMKQKYNKNQSICNSNHDNDQIDTYRFKKFDNLIDCKLSHLKPIGVLGVGTLSTVTLVEDPHTSQTYCLKKMRKNRIVETYQQIHIRNERTVLANIDSDFCVRLYATYQDRLNIYFLMEAVLGGELFYLLKFNRQFPEKASKFYASCIVLALEHLHSKNIIYRDLKPENILVAY